MGNELSIESARKFDGKAMASLSDQQRGFVLTLMDLGPSKRAAAHAARKCGYTAKYGYDLMRDERILLAIREEATKQIAGDVLLGVKVLAEIARDKMHKDRFRAADKLAGLNGFTTEQRIVVEHVAPDRKNQIDQIRSMATELGLDPGALLRGIGINDAEIIVAEDAEFTDVETEATAV